MTKNKKQPLGLTKKLRDADAQQRRSIIAGLPHDVGFAKPPKATRFKPGRSGNPAGRKPGTPNLRTVLNDELARPIEVKEGGRTRKLSKAQVMMCQVVNKAAAGDLRAFGAVNDMARKTGLLNEAPASREQPFSTADMQIAAELMRVFGVDATAAGDASEDSAGSDGHDH